MRGGGLKKEVKNVNMVDVLYRRMDMEFLNMLKPP
jgi:uncharacterized circularly permuted ATP-grasp superfamily protein